MHRHPFVLVPLVALACHPEATSAEEFEHLPKFPEYFLISDEEPTPDFVTAFPTIIDARKIKRPSREISAGFVYFADSDLRGGLEDGLRNDFGAFAMRQWSSSKVLQKLGGQPILVDMLELTYLVLADRRPLLLQTMPPLQGAAAAAMETAFGRRGLLSLHLKVTVGDQQFAGFAALQYGGNGTILPYATRSLFKSAAQQVAQQILDAQ